MTLGERLKEARETKGLSLDSLQETTKIQKRYLIAIEEGNFKILPGKFYARAFIKEYAIAVGLDANELLEEFKEEIPNTEEEDTTQYTSIRRSRKDNHPSKNSAIFSLVPTIIVIVLIIGIVFFAWFFYQKTISDKDTAPVDETNDNEIIYPGDNQENKEEDLQPDEEPDNAEQAEDTSEEDMSQPDDTTEEETSQPEFSVVEKGTGNSPESTVELNNTGDELIVTLESDGASYIEVENENGESFFSGMFTAEQSPMEVDVTGAERLYFNVGRATEFKASINGVELEYPVDPNEFIHQYIWVNIK